MQKVRREDTVIVISGKDRGKTGVVRSVITAKNRLIVDGVNMIKKHAKPNPTRGVAGGIIEREASLHVSNVALFNPATKCADRVGFRILDDGRKVRYFKSNNEIVDV